MSKKDLSDFTETKTDGRKRCIGCCYRVRDDKTFRVHLKEHKCDQAMVCEKCGIFRTIDEGMLAGHQSTCTRATSPTPSEEANEEPVVPKKKKRRKKVQIKKKKTTTKK